MPLAKGSLRLALALAAVPVAISVAAACVTSASPAVDVDAGDGDGASPTRAACPKAEPAAGEACDLPEGTTCDYGTCGTQLAECTNGAWRRAGNTAPNPPCPEAPPTADAGCPPCWPKTRTCTYDTACRDPDASRPVNAALASCPNEVWELVIEPCPDVQGGDAGLDGGRDGD